MRRHFYILLILLGLVTILAGCNCEDTGNIGTERELIATPSALNFDGKEGETITKKVLITAKRGTIQIDKISVLEGGSHYTLVKDSLPDLPKTLAEGDSFTLSIEYKATKGAAPAGKIRLESDATTPDDGHLDILLLARNNQQQLSFDPDPVNFGSVESGGEKTIEVKGENLGRADLVITDIKKQDGTSAAYSFPDGFPQTPFTVKPGETFKFKVQYNPDSATTDKGAILFTCEGGCSPDDPDPTRQKDPFALRLVGTVGKAGIEVTPQALDFGFVAAGSEKQMRFKITNIGQVTLRIAKISLKRLSSGAFQVPTLIDVEIPRGQSKEVIVKYRPSVGSEDKGTVEISSNDPGKPLVSVSLVGKVTSPNIEVSPKELAFGKAPIVKKMTITIANSGNQPLIVDPVQMMPGTSNEFSFEKTPSKLTITPNTTASVVVVYKPVDKVDDSGTVLIPSNDPDTPVVQVKLRGLGLAPKVCDLAPQPTNVVFGMGVLGKSVVREVALTNQGLIPCELTNLSVVTDRSGFPPYIGPDVFFITNMPASCKNGTCSPAVVVQPGNSLKLKVSFLPQFERETLSGNPAYTGWINTSSGAAGETPTNRRITLNGIGARGCVTLVPDKIDMGLVTTNCASRNETVLIYNTCPTPIDIKKISWANGQSNGFQIVSAAKTPFTIQPQKEASIVLRYKATAPPKKQTAVLHVEHSFGAISPLVANLAAEGTDKTEQTDTFKQPNAAQADVLFVIDNSCSMGDEQSSLSRNVGSFIQWATTLKADFHFAITTTEVDARAKFKPGEFRGTVTKVFTKNTPNLVASFQAAAKVGTNTLGQESGLDGAYEALQPKMLQGPNKGFLRTDASLSIIAISDEADQSKQAVQFYLNFFKGLKGGPRTDQFKFHSVIGYDTKTKQNKCSTGNGSGSGSSQDPYSSGRYLAMSQATNGIVASICNTAWSSVFQKIGLLTFAQRKDYYLSRPADPKSIVVKVDGQVVSNGSSTWNYDAQSNAIVFVTAPKGGATITVTYKVICY
jgi:hypothetical protein